MATIKRSVAVVVRGPKAGMFLVVKRPDDPGDPLAGVWGLPAVSLADIGLSLATTRPTLGRRAVVLAAERDSSVRGLSMLASIHPLGERARHNRWVVTAAARSHIGR